MPAMLTPPLLALLVLAGIGLCGLQRRKALAALLLTVMTSASMSLVYALAHSFTNEGLNAAVVFHLLHGLAADNRIGVAQFPELAALSFAVFAALGLWTWLVIRRSRTCRKALNPTQTTHERFAHIFLTNTALVAAVMAVPLHPALLQSVQLWRELRLESPETLTAELKSIPLQVTYADSGRPFVLVYAESFELAFFDQGAFPDLAPELTALKEDSLSFSNIGEAPLTNWTMAGMVASQCGVPLAPIGYRSQDNYTSKPHFTPGSDCLGDVLKTRGYRLEYVGGASLSFAGKGRYYRNHGFDEVIGKDEIGDIVGANFPHSKWGAYDDDVFEAALHRFRALKLTPSPFGLVVLTTATHPPEGFPSPSCNMQYDNSQHPLLNAAHCSDREVANFIRQIEAEAPDNLIIVVASDHLQIGSGIGPLFDQMRLPRQNLLFIRGLDRTGVIEREATTLDIAPTLLSLLTSAHVDSMALGRNLLEASPTLSEHYGRAEFYQMLQPWRTNLWKTTGVHMQQAAETSQP